MLIDKDGNRVRVSRKPLKAQKEFLKQVLNDNQDKFEDAFEQLRMHDPKRWVELYVDISKHIIPKSQNVNVNVGINKDFRELRMLATTTAVPQLIDGRPADSFGERGMSVEDAEFQELQDME